MNAAISATKVEDQGVTAANTEATRQGSSLVSRVVSIDVYRGLVMFLMLLEITHLSEFAAHQYESSGFGFWNWIHYHTSHVEWFGCSLHDLIQPGFSFLVGTSMAFSIHSRKKRGDSFGRMFFHALSRAFILIFLGIFLRSLGYAQPRFTFDDTLTQIGMGYIFLFLIAWLPAALQYFSLAFILIGYWALFASYPAPGIDFDYAAVGVPSDWEHHRDGFESHWNKNSNAAWAFDLYWMNLFPREQDFRYSSGGYVTLSFIPTLGTMLLGLFAGHWLRTLDRLSSRGLRFIVMIMACAGIAIFVDAMGWCPIVKRIWTPTWTLYSGAWCLGFLFALHLICDVAGYSAWSYPLRVIGANSIAAYVMSWTFEGWVKENITRHFGWVFQGLSEPAYNLWVGSLTLLIIWLILYWMFRRNILLRI